MSKTQPKSHLSPLTTGKAVWIAIGAWALYTFGGFILDSLGSLVPGTTDTSGIDQQALSEALANNDFAGMVTSMGVTQTTLGMAMMVVAAIVMTLIMLLWYRKSYAVNTSPEGRRIVLKRWLSPKALLTLFLLACGIMTLSTIVGTIVSALMPDQTDFFASVSGMVSNESPWWFIVLFVCVVGPIGEELTYRGVAQHAMQRSKLGIVPILIIQALLFGVMHMIPFQVLYAFIVGIPLGWICYKTRSILPTIIIHIMNNSLSSVFAYIPDGASLPIEVALGVLAVLGIVLIARGKLSLEPAPTPEQKLLAQGLDPTLPGNPPLWGLGASYVKQMRKAAAAAAAGGQAAASVAPAAAPAGAPACGQAAAPADAAAPAGAPVDGQGVASAAYEEIEASDE